MSTPPMTGPGVPGGEPGGGGIGAFGIAGGGGGVAMLPGIVLAGTQSITSPPGVTVVATTLGRGGRSLPPGAHGSGP